MVTMYDLEMKDSDHDHLNIVDLPDEILCIIFAKLNMVDVLDSLVDVNRQFDRLALDSLYIRDLDMTNLMNINSLYDHSSSISTQVLARICQKVLYRIDDQIHRLTVEQYSMKSILHAAKYSHLYSLSLLNFNEVILDQYLTDDSILRDLLTKQITHLYIDIKTTTEPSSETVPKIFALILSLCPKLLVLNFCDMFSTRTYSTPLFHLLWERAMSSTLNKLQINVTSLIDCLYLLDGPLVCLSTLIVKVTSTFHPFETINSTRKLPKLKYFSFTTLQQTFDYDTLIVPLLCRMTHLEELKLYLLVERWDSTFIDGIQLYDQFLIYMTQLNKFTFDIKTKISSRNARVELPSNEDIQNSFIGRRGYQQVASHIHKRRSSKCNGICHIYSLPYDFEYFYELDHSFPGGIFYKVRQVTMIDTTAFKYQLFQCISQSFPFLQFLDIWNIHAQKDKEHSSKPISFPYLINLTLKWSHIDYAELFLWRKNMHLPRLLNLSVEYKTLTMITNHFTNNPTDFNFDRLKSLDLGEPFVRPGNFHQYFPLL